MPWSNDSMTRSSRCWRSLSFEARKTGMITCHICCLPIVKFHTRHRVFTLWSKSAGPLDVLRESEEVPVAVYVVEMSENNSCWLWSGDTWSPGQQDVYHINLLKWWYPAATDINTACFAQLAQLGDDDDEGIIDMDIPVIEMPEDSFYRSGSSASLQYMYRSWHLTVCYFPLTQMIMHSCHRHIPNVSEHKVCSKLYLLRLLIYYQTFHCFWGFTLVELSP